MAAVDGASPLGEVASPTRSVLNDRRGSASTDRARQPRSPRSVRRRHGAVCGGAVPAGRAADRVAGRVRLYRSRAQRHAGAISSRSSPIRCSSSRSRPRSSSPPRSASICCLVAAPMGWIVARSDIPFSRTIRMLVMASFVTPPFLGAIAWELLAAPNSGLLNQLYRAATGAGPDVVLFNIYTLTGLIFVISCYTFPYVFVLVANALDRIPGDLEDASAMLGGSAWRTARRVTIPLALPALAAGALVAFLQAMTLFGSPAILALPAGFHTMTTKIWSLFQYPPKPELAAAAALPLLVLTVVLLRAQAFVLGRRGYTVVGGKSGAPRLVRLGWLRWPALSRCFAMLCLPVFLPYGALVNAAFSRIAEPAADARHGHAAQRPLCVLRAVRHQARHEEHVPAGRARGHLRHAAGPGDRLSDRARSRHRPSRAGLSRHRAHRHPRHRAGRRTVPRLYARADRALRHAVDFAPRLSHDRAARRLPAAAVLLPRAGAGAGGGQPHPRRVPPQDPARPSPPRCWAPA